MHDDKKIHYLGIITSGFHINHCLTIPAFGIKIEFNQLPNDDVVKLASNMLNLKIYSQFTSKNIKIPKSDIPEKGISEGEISIPVDLTYDPNTEENKRLKERIDRECHEHNQELHRKNKAIVDEALKTKKLLPMVTIPRKARSISTWMRSAFVKLGLPKKERDLCEFLFTSDTELWFLSPSMIIPVDLTKWNTRHS